MQAYFIKHLAFTIFILLHTTLARADINFDQMKKDIETLASDDMQGRKVFTPAIDKAADYIEKRFTEIGLVPFNNDSLKQDFYIYKIDPQSSSIKLNGTLVKKDNLSTLSFYKNKSSKKVSDFKVINVSEKDDFRTVIGQANHNERDTVLLVNPKHRDIFKRYQSFLSRSKNRFEVNQGPSLVIIMTQEKVVDSIEVEISNSISKQRLSNVVGLLKANAKQPNKNESVIFSAHYDHLGVTDKVVEQKNSLDGSNKPIDLIFNGADDDASGTTAVINLASHYSEIKERKRDLIFVAFTAEEIGGFGSQYFSKQLDTNNIVAMINIEMIGKKSKFGESEFWMTGTERSNLDEIMQIELDKNQQKLFSDPYPKQRLFYRSDNATLARLGVPAHSFSTDEIDKDPHYHKAGDEVKTLNLRSMFNVINKIGNATNSLVTGTIKPTRLDTSKVNKKGYFF